VRELKKGPPLFSMLASVSVYPLPHFFLLFLSCPVYLNGLTLVMGFFGALVRPLLLLATPTTCCHKRESFQSRTGWFPATETLLDTAVVLLVRAFIIALIRSQCVITEHAETE